MFSVAVSGCWDGDGDFSDFGDEMGCGLWVGRIGWRGVEEKGGWVILDIM